MVSVYLGGFSNYLNKNAHIYSKKTSVFPKHTDVNMHYLTISVVPKHFGINDLGKKSLKNKCNCEHYSKMNFL